ncbi:unnamed protein product [Caenorhabditis auriculariae]|uniref:Uncharacterized protein n=1 Tax=Caenorhabditis auriculariae TaxID=2777116 RepID=A0A8S1GTS4_9PELO|nr:unnamed protein product [Caenorhabditis auriculariae]
MFGGVESKKTPKLHEKGAEGKAEASILACAASSGLLEAEDTQLVLGSVELLWTPSASLVGFCVSVTGALKANHSRLSGLPRSLNFFFSPPVAAIYWVDFIIMEFTAFSAPGGRTFWALAL